MKQTQIEMSDKLSVIEQENQWTYKVEDNYTQYTKSLEELKKKHHDIYEKIQSEFEVKLGYRVGHDVKLECF